ncbi:MAG: hypothetical protein GY811_00965 [Myxococcales bacterium]|nr:hypothetical protein [Myxococcales bacterium]
MADVTAGGCHSAGARADSDASAFFATLEQLICEESASCVFFCTDQEVSAYADESPSLSCPISGPSPELSAILEDKAATYSAVEEPELFPWTLEIDSEADVDRVFGTLGSPLWLRARVCSGARRALKLQSADERKAWIRYWRELGGMDDTWVIHEFLPGAIINWTGLYHSGNLIAGAAMQRMRYLLGESAMSLRADGPWNHGRCIRLRRSLRRSHSQIVGESTGHLLYRNATRCAREAKNHRDQRSTGWPSCAPGTCRHKSTSGCTTDSLGQRRGRTVGEALAPSGPRLGVRMRRQIDVEPLVTS